MYRQPNAERVVILVNITRLATFLLNPVLTAVHLIIHAINVHHANPLRPATTQLMSAALTDVRLTVLAALLAKLANHLLLAAVAVPVAVPAAVAHAINTNLVQQNAPALPNTKAHCQTDYAPKYYVVCNLKITRDWVNCSGQSKTSSGTAYDRRGTYSTQAACEAAAAKTTCSCSSYTWPYCCSKEEKYSCNAF